MKNKKVYLIVGIVIIGIILFIFISHKWDGIVNKEINNKIESIGGQVENIEKIDVSKTPFKKDNVGGIYFEITYEHQGKHKIAYYRRHNSLNIESIPSKGAPVEWIIEE